MQRHHLYAVIALGMSFVFGTRPLSNVPEDQLQPESKGVVAMQWSMHWQCFISKNPSCAESAVDLVPKFLNRYDVDFANLGMFQMSNSSIDNWRNDPNAEKENWAPSGYEAFDLACSTDNIKILYNSLKWELVPESDFAKAPKIITDLDTTPTENMYGCFEQNGQGKPDRVYGIVQFKRKASPEETIIVVFSHFPHPPGGTSSSDNAEQVDPEGPLAKVLGPKINQLKQAAPDSKVILIGDFNLDMPYSEKEGSLEFGANTFQGKMWKHMPKEPAMSSEDIWETLAITSSPTLTAKTDYKLACCSDKPKQIDGNKVTPVDEIKFAFAYDRILSNFGTMETVMPLENDDGPIGNMCRQEDENPSEFTCPFYVGAFHKPIIGKIGVS